MALLKETFITTINNICKLNNELGELDLFGEYFSHTFSPDEDHIDVYYNGPIPQPAMDELSAHINNFIETDVVMEAAQAYEKQTDEGFDLYRKMIVDINITSGGVGLNASLDESIRLYIGASDINTMVVSLIDIRCMLKDKFIEYTLRSLHSFLDPAIGFTQDQLDRYSGWIEKEITNKMLSDGISQATIDATIGALKTAPKGMV